MRSKKRSKQIEAIEDSVKIKQSVTLDKAIQIVLDNQKSIDSTTAQAVLNALTTQNNLIRQAMSVNLSDNQVDSYLPKLRFMDRNQLAGMFSWGGRDYPYKSKFKLGQMLYYSGQLVVINSIDGAKFFKIGGNTQLTSYGEIEKIRAVQFNGYLSEYEKTLVNIDYTNNIDCVVLNTGIQDFTGQTAVSTKQLNEVILNAQAKVLARVAMNIDINAKKAIIQVEDKATQRDIENSLNSAISSDSAVVAVSTGKINILDLVATGGLDGGELFHMFKQYNSYRLNSSGIPSTPLGTDKGERLISGEVDNNMFNYDLIHDVLLDVFQEFCDNCEKILGLNFTVTSNIDKIKKEKEIEKRKVIT